MLRLYTIPEICKELGLTDAQARHRIKRLGIQTIEEKGGRGRPHLLAPLQPFLQPFPGRVRKAR